jgi:hypothetical protein
MPYASEVVTWYQWLDVSETVGSGKTEVTKKVKSLETEQGKLSEVIELLKTQCITLAHHMFCAKWQYRQFRSLQANLPTGWVLKVLDFAENYRPMHQNEVQTAHYAYHLITVHPCVTYYRCPLCSALVEESMVCISDDLKHDGFAVKAFVAATNKHLKETRGLQITKEVQFTDGCGVQYKSKKPFYDISQSHKENDHIVERNYFGTRHGKGPADRLAAVVKQATSQAVKADGLVVKNAQDMFAYLEREMTIDKGNGCQHKLRKFFLVQDIERKEEEKLKRIVGTMDLHCVAGVCQGVVKVREKSCYCYMCIDGRSDLCINVEFTDEWDDFDVRKGQGDKKKVRNGRQTAASLRAMVKKRVKENGKKTSGCNPKGVQKKEVKMSEKPNTSRKGRLPSKTEQVNDTGCSTIDSKRPVRKCRMRSCSGGSAVSSISKLVQHDSPDRPYKIAKLEEKITRKKKKKNVKSSLIKKFDSV